MKRNHLFAPLIIAAAALWSITGQAQAGFPSGSNSFALAPTIASNTALDGAVTNVAAFTKEASEPLAGSDDQTAWWNWTPDASGWCSLNTEGSTTVSNYLHVFNGNSLGTLTTVARSDFYKQKTGELYFFAQAGVTYHLRASVPPIFDSPPFPDDGSVTLHFRHYVPGKRRYLASWILDAGSGLIGALDVSTSSSGAATGKLTLAGRATAFKGQVGGDGVLEVVFAQGAAKGSAGSAPISLTMDLVTSNKGASCRVTSGAFTSGLFPASQPRTFSAQTPNTIAPRHTASIRPNAVFGAGFMLVNVSRNGAAKLAGRFCDGRKFSAGSAMCETGLASVSAVPVALSLNRGDLQWQGDFKLSEGMVDEIEETGGSFYFRRAGISGAFFTAGIAQYGSIRGGAYTPPATGQRAMGFLDGSNGAAKLKVTDAPGELAAFMENLAFSTANTFAFQSQARKPALKFSAKTGLITGSVQTAAGTVRKMSGILAGGATPALYGTLTGDTQTVRFQVTP